MMICERCLEPMPVCDDSRSAYAYVAIQELPARRRTTTVVADGDPRTQRPTLRKTSVTSLFARTGSGFPGATKGEAA